MKELLDIIYDVADVRSRVNGVQSAARGGFNNWCLVAWPDSRLYVCSK